MAKSITFRTKAGKTVAYTVATASYRCNGCGYESGYDGEQYAEMHARDCIVVEIN